MGSDPAFIIFLPKFKIFQSTLPGWGATGAGCRGEMAVRISIHAPRMGSDETMPGTNDITYISIHAPRMGSDMRRANSSPRRPISIHAPRMGSDAVFAMPQVWWRISIHAPRMGSDHPARTGFEVIVYFNPRSPDGERPWRGTCRYAYPHFNPRSPDGERLSPIRYSTAFDRFQSTLPGWGATFSMHSNEAGGVIFQSTLPGWGATVTRHRVKMHLKISIHAPRMGSDTHTPQ